MPVDASTISAGDPPVILVVATDPGERTACASILADLGDVIPVALAAEAENILRSRDVHVLVCEDELAGETGLMFLARINRQHPWMRRLMLCGPLDSELLVALINDAAVFRVITRPFAPADLRQQVTTALHEAARLRRLAFAEIENTRLKTEMSRPPYLARRAQMIVHNWTAALPRLMTLFLLTAAGLVAAAVATFLLIYLLKSVFGIDLIPGAHLKDWLH